MSGQVAPREEPGELALQHAQVRRGEAEQSIGLDHPAGHRRQAAKVGERARPWHRDPGRERRDVVDGRQIQRRDRRVALDRCPADRLLDLINGTDEDDGRLRDDGGNGQATVEVIGRHVQVLLAVELARMRHDEREHRVDRDLAPVRQGHECRFGVRGYPPDGIEGVSGRGLAGHARSGEREIRDVARRQLVGFLDATIDVSRDGHRSPASGRRTRPA